MALTAKLRMEMVKKQLRANRDRLKQEKHQIESIQMDMGVDILTGNVLREKVSYEFIQTDLQKAIELLATTQPATRSAKSCVELSKIIKVTKFFQETIVPMKDEDALGIVKRL